LTTVNAHARLAKALRGRYDIGPVVGAGGMADVYLAQDLRHGRRVAIKALRWALDEFSTARFLAEIRVTAALQHPNILPLFDSGSAAGVLYYVTPYIQGGSIRDRLDRRGRLRVSEALEVARAVATALQYAHDSGVVHRDIKPENILMVENAPLIADFGISLKADGNPDLRLTKPGASPGSPLYMSPEQLAGEPSLDGRSDVYSLASVLYEMLVGTPPFCAESAQALARRLLCELPLSARALRPEVPAHVDAALLKALSKLPADRFASALDFSGALVEDAPGPSPDADLELVGYGSTPHVAPGQ
jgi:serine/threonine protein kinase